MAGVGDDDVLGLGPGAGQFVRGDGGADDIVAPLDDDRGDFPQHRHIVEQEVFVHEHVVPEVVGLDAGQAQGRPVDTAPDGALGLGPQGGAGVLVAAPCPSRRHVHRRVGIGEAAVVGVQKVAPFALGQEPGKFPPRLGEDGAHSVQEPVALALAAQEDPAQHEPRAVLGPLDAIGQGQGGAPRAAEDQPAFDAQVAAQGVDIRDQVRGRVVAQLGEGS